MKHACGVLERTVASLQLILGVVFAVTFVWLSFVARFPVPYRDDWAWLYATLTGRPFSLGALFTPRNEHLIPLSSLMYALEYALVGPSGWPIFVLAVVLQLVLAWVFLREIKRAWPHDGLTRRVMCGVVISLVCSSYQLQSVVFTAAIPFPLVQTLSALAIVCWLNAGPDGRRFSGWHLLSFAVTSLAILSYTNGFALPMVLALFSLVRRDHRGVVIVYATLLVLAVALYICLVMIPPSPSFSDGAGDVKPTAATMAIFVFSFFGSGIAYGSVLASILIGAVAIFIGAVALFGVIHDRDRTDRLTSFAAALMLFSLASAAMAAVGRSRFGTLQAAESRYATMALTYWAAASLFVVHRLIDAPARVEKFHWIGLSSLLFTTLMLGGHLFTGAVWKAKKDNVAAAGLTAATGARDDEWVETLYPNPQFVYGVEDALVARGDIRLLDSRLGLGVRLGSVPACHASLIVERVERGAGWRVTGRLVERATEVLVLDRAQQIRGIAQPAPLVATPSPSTTAFISAVADSIAARAHPTAPENRWLGFSQVGSGPPFSAVALNRVGAMVCQTALPAHGAIHTALDAVRVSGSAVVAEGWAFACDESLERVAVVIDGIEHAATRLGSNRRPDVQNVYSSCSNSADSGLALSIADVSSGTHRIAIRAVAAPGRSVDSNQRILQGGKRPSSQAIRTQ